MASNRKADICVALDMLCSLHDGDRGVLAAIACGEDAVPGLKAILFRSDPSGLFETRCRAVRALKALGAHNVLAEFLSDPHLAADPVQRMGDEAVVNTAARAIETGVRDGKVFRLLLRLAHARPYLAGVIEALARYDQTEAVPALVRALGEDASRPAAEAGLMRIGKAAGGALVAAATSCWPSAANESDGNRRKRRSALGLLACIADTGQVWPQLRDLIHDADPRISFLACKFCLIHATTAERSKAVERLNDLLPSADWMLREDIHECLAASIRGACVSSKRKSGHS